MNYSSSNYWMCLLLTIFCILSLGCNNAEEPDIVIRNARLIDGTGAIHENATITISHGRIEKVSSEEVKTKGKAQIDAHGRTVVPGLIDAHIHLLMNMQWTIQSDSTLKEFTDEQLPERLQDYLRHGITTVLDTGDWWPHILEIRKRLASGELQGPRLLIAGPVFTALDGHPAVTVGSGSPWRRKHIAVEVSQEEAAREKIRELAQNQVDVIKVVLDGMLGEKLSSDLLKVIIDEAHTQKVPVVVHALTVDDAVMALDLGADALVHTPTGPGIEDGKLIQRLLEGNKPVTSTLAGNAPVVDEAGVQRNIWTNREYSERDRAFFESLKANFKVIIASGATIVFGTDLPMLAPGRSFHFEAETLVKAGLTPQQVIQAATRDAAQYLGLENLGTIEPGKLADLVILDGDPLTDIAALKKVQVVIKNGQVVIDNRQSQPDSDESS